MVVIMDQPWFRKLFGGPAKVPPENTQTRADHGDPEAQFSLASNYADREGTTPDDALAVHWFLKAANQNHALAQLNLGIMFAEGRGIARDKAQGLFWIGKAATQGNPAAQHDLGLRCRHASFGKLPNDAMESKLEAYKWLRLAASQGHRGSEAAFETVALIMTREEVIQANQRTAEFLTASAKHGQL